MAGSIAKLVVSLGANIAGFETDMKRAQRNQSRRMKQLERDAKRAGAVIGAALGTGLVLATREAIKFEKAMAEVSTLLDDTSSLDNLSNSVKQLSIQFGQAPTEQAKALYQIISAGASDAATQVELLTASNKLAVGGVTDVRTAADGLTTVLNAYAGSGLDSAQASDILFTTMKQGKTTIEELSSSIGNVATIAAQVGVSFEEVGATVGTLTKVGLNTSQAMTALQGVLAAVVKQGKQSVDAADELGIAFNTAAIQSQGFAGFLKTIADSGATEEQLSKLFGRVEGLTAVMALGSNEMEEFTAQLEAQAEGAGATEEAVAKMADTTAFKIAQATNAFQVLSIEIGSTFLAAISDVAVGARDNIDTIRKFIVQLVESFRVLGAVAQAVGAGLVATFVTIKASIVSAVLATIAALSGLNDVALAIIQQNFAAVPRIVENAMKGMAAALNDGGEEIANAMGFAAESIAGINEAVIAAGTALNDFDASLKPPVSSAKAVATEIAKTTTKIENNTKALDKNSKEWRELGKDVSSFIDDVLDTDAFDTLVDQVESLIDSVDPVGKLFRDLGEQIKFVEENAQLFINRGFTAEEVIRLLELRAREAAIEMLGLGESAEEAAKGVDRAATAMDESVRIMENIFQDLFSGIVGESDEAWSAIENGFQEMVGRISSTSFRGISEQFQKAFGADGGGFGSIDFRQVGLQFGQIAASAFADDIVTGIFGDQDTGTDYVEIGKQIGTVVGSVIGSFIPVIGTALGAIIGAFSGALKGLIFGKLFGRELEAQLGGVIAGAGALQQSGVQVLSTPLSDVVGIHGQGGFGDLNDPDTPGGKIGEAIKTLDQAIFDILKSVGGADQLAVVQDALENWEGTWEKGAVTVENILGSRFDTILSTFGDHVQDFVNNVDDIEGQVERFAVALQVDKLFEELPDALGGRTQAEFLSIIERYKGAFQSIGEAADEVIGLFIEIASQLDFLSEFAGSDLGADFDQLLNVQGRTLGQALGDANSQLFDLIANFDGSVGSLQEISGLVFSIREGEIQLLQQIDSIQKGLTASLQNLRDFVTGASEGPQTITQTFLDAEDLLRQLGSATSAEEVARIGREFDALIRGLDQDQLKLAGPDLLTLIDVFDRQSSDILKGFRDDVVSNSEVIRTAVDDFIARIGDPLDIISASLEGQNLPEAMQEGFTEVADNNTANTDRLIAAIYDSAGGVVVVNPDQSLVNQ